MKLINYRFTAVEPLHHGSDENLGTLRRLRREVVKLNNKILIESRFEASESKLRRQVLSLILLCVWKSIDDKARYTIYDEFHAAIISACAGDCKHEWLRLICAKTKVRNAQNSLDTIDLLSLLDVFSDSEFIDLILSESHIIILEFRKIVKDVALTKATELVASEVLKRPFKTTERVKSNAQIPVISGNGIRGLLRRLVMRDFCEYVGLKDLTPNVYHMLFTGGTISESTGIEDIAKRRELINLCPMLGLFGSAIGNGTIQGALICGQARLVCSENQLGSVPANQLTQIVFATRLDSAKQSEEIDESEDKATHQMKYETECVIVGAEFEHTLACKSIDTSIMNAFHAAMTLFTANPFICAKSSIGHGHIDLTQLTEFIDKTSVEAYYEHLTENKEAITKYFKNAGSK